MTDAALQEVLDEALARLTVVEEDATEPRGLQGRSDLLTSALSIAVLGCLCGCDDAEALQDWAEKEDDRLTDYLELRWGGRRRTLSCACWPPSTRRSPMGLSLPTQNLPRVTQLPRSPLD